MLFKTKDNIELDDKERNDLKRLAYNYGIDLYAIDVVRNTGLTWKGAVGCFSMWHPRTIFICADQKCLLSLLPVLAHELCHLKQYESVGFIRYCLLAIPFIRKWTIEKDAYKIEDRIHEMVTSYPRQSP